MSLLQLEAELSLWAHAGLVVPLWWRDDDAVAATPALDRLLALLSPAGAAVALAVIPSRADASLRRFVGAGCTIWQHGWSHTFYDNGEFGDGRDLTAMRRDALAGQRALDALFGPGGWQRVFVPPNHCLSLEFKSSIHDLGFLGVSAGVPLTAHLPGVREVNADVDVMDWPAGALLPDPVLYEAVASALAERRTDTCAVTKPLGILTHHLAFRDNDWTRVARLIRYLSAHSSIRFVHPSSLFAGIEAQAMDTGPRTKKPHTPPVTVVVTSCGRQDLLEESLDSFFAFNTYDGVQSVIIMEDGDGDLNAHLAQKYRHRPCRWLCTGRRVGQIQAIDSAYASVETEYFFHCEDDWEFLAPGFIEKSFAVLDTNPGVLQVWLRGLSDTNGHPVLPEIHYADGVEYRLLDRDFRSTDWGTWHGFSFNPGLRRLSDYRRLGSFARLAPSPIAPAYEVERAAARVYRDQGLVAAILSDRGTTGYVRHRGWGRRVPSPVRKGNAEP